MTLKQVWVVTCDGTPVGAYVDENAANLFAIRASGLMEISGFKVSPVMMHDQAQREDQTVFTAPLAIVPSVSY